MKGLDIVQNGYLETVNNGSTTLSLLSRGEGIEVMEQKVVKGKLIILFPSEDSTTLEFFYIFSGELETEIDGNKVTLHPNAHFSAKNLKETVQFIAKTDVRLLSVSTAPVFHLLSNDISELRKIGELVEQKDRYTFKHSSRVAGLAVKTATKMKIEKSRIQDLFLASILHDIGKINIPEEVLKKPEKLTDEEFALVKKHPGDGAAMIRETPYADIADIVEQHHERVNGRGYPFGLKGEDILLEAKIIGVCDTFDAMTEDRAYRQAFSIDYALNEIQQLAGVQYDSEVVEAFIQVIKEEKLIL